MLIYADLLTHTSINILFGHVACLNYQIDGRGLEVVSNILDLGLAIICQISIHTFGLAIMVLDTIFKISALGLAKMNLGWQ